MKRRDFIKASALGATVPASMLVSCSSVNSKIKTNKDNPIILSTWAHGLPANVAERITNVMKTAHYHL